MRSRISSVVFRASYLGHRISRLSAVSSAASDSGAHYRALLRAAHRLLSTDLRPLVTVPKTRFSSDSGCISVFCSLPLLPTLRKAYRVVYIVRSAS